MSKTGITLKLLGQNGNAMCIIGAATKALKRNGKADLVDEFVKEATSGDYDKVLQTCMHWFEVE